MTPEEIGRYLDAVDPEWPTLAPLPDGLPAVPPFDVERLLPVALAPWVNDIATRAQCPPDFIAVPAVVSVGAIIGRKIAIRPKRHDDWTVVPNLWGAVVGRPGTMKTPAMAEATRPVYRLVQAARQAHQDDLKGWEFAQEESKARRELLKTKLREALKAGRSTDEIRAAFEAPEPTRPTERRYIVNDSTIEKLGELLDENPNGLLLFRDELTGFLRGLDREGHENDRSFYCEAWNGTGSYTYDRISRGTIHIEAPCVSILGGIQPGPLHAYLREVFGAGHTDDGLIQRFQLLVYPDVSAEWRNVDRWPDSAAKIRAFEIYAALDRIDGADVGAGEHLADGRPFLRFAPEAQSVFDAWRERLEIQLRRDDEHPVLVSHFAKYRSLVPSLALVFHLVDCAYGSVGHGHVSLAATDRAIAWSDYLAAHAGRVYQSVTAGPRMAALALAAKLKRGAVPNPFLARQVRLKGWSGLTSPEDVSAAVAVLEDLGWLRSEAIPATGRGGRPTLRYHVNPAVVVTVSEVLEVTSVRNTEMGGEAEDGFGGFDGASAGEYAATEPVDHARATRIETLSSSSSGDLPGHTNGKARTSETIETTPVEEEV